MGLVIPPEVIRALDHPLRWTMLTRLVTTDCRVHELADALEQPVNLVSYHLKQLRDAGLVTARQSEADGRDWYYSINFEALQAAYWQAGASLGLAPQPAETAAQKPLRVLFVCTHNSARSQMAEGLLRHLSQGRCESYSAGHDPLEIQPEAVTVMDEFGIDIHHQAAKSTQVFSDQTFDYIITVCDRARERQTALPDGRARLHWGYRDPLMIADPEARLSAFRETARQLTRRIHSFLQTVQSLEHQP